MHKTGCEGPFKNGTGGWCGCNCKCCPPPCCQIISVYFQCGAPLTPENPYGCDFEESCASFTPMSCDPPLSFMPPQIPKFNLKPIVSEDKKFTLGGGSTTCSVPCDTVCVEVYCGGILPCCCLQLIGGIIYAVGNGYVTAPSTVEIPGCGEANVLLNGMTPPIFVLDGEIVTVTLTFDPEYPECCCCCEQIDIDCSPCSGAFANKQSLWKRKVDPRTGKTKINPKTGKPMIVINKKELIKRVISRIRSSRRK